MATIEIADNDARVQYTQAVTADTTQLTIDYPFFGLDDINVIVTSAAGVDTTLSRGTGTGTFAVVGTSVDDGFSGGYVTLGDTYSDAATKYTIFRNIAVERTTDFPTSGPFNISSLNTELDKIFAIEQELETQLNRTMKLAESDTAATLSLPNLDTRKGTVLAFNATSGLPEAGPNIGDVSTISAITADISTLADIEDGTDATDAIQTVAGISSNVSTVAGISGNVSTVASVSANVTTVAGVAANVTTVAGVSSDVATVAGISADVTTVAADGADIGTVAGISANVTNVSNISSDVTTAAGISANITSVAGNETNINTVAANDANITTVAGIDSDVTTVAGISSGITAVAADATDIGTVSTNIADVSTVAGISSDVTTVAADGTDIGVVAGISSDVTTVSGIAANVTSVAGISSDVTAVAADATDIGTVATNIANVNTAAGISANITTVAGIASDVTAAATNASDISAIAAEVAKVVTVANDLNEATSEIDVVANNIANVNLVGADITAVINASNNLSDINNFGDTYFISATAPSSPTTGDLWFDTSSDTMKVYGGSGFQNAGSSVNGTSQRVSYTATAGQTSFAATYDAGYVDVYLNGIKLISGTDFTATNGTSIVLSSGAALNDTVDIVAFGTFVLSNFSVGDANDVSVAGASSGDVLTYNGSAFAPSAPSVPTLSSLSIANHDQVTVTAGGAVTATSFAGDGSSLTGLISFASGTKMLFGQTAAPTGWTKITTDNDAALRIVSGTVGTGGSVALSTALGTPTVTGTIAGSTGSHTLSTSEMPSHNHSYTRRTGSTNIKWDNFTAYTTNVTTSNSGSSTGSTGGGGSHSHSLSATFSGGAAAINVKYVDVIMASKD